MPEKIIAVFKDNKKNNRLGFDADSSLEYLSFFLTPVVPVFPDFIKEVKRKIALVNMSSPVVKVKAEMG
jgi:hypothetical protein